MRILLFIGIGLAVGSVSGALGIGGGVLLIPLLVWLCGMDTKKAAGTSLAILVPPIGLPAALLAYREERVDLEAALWIAGAFMFGAYGSQYLIQYLPVDALKFLFGLLMFYVGARFLLSTDSEAANAAAGLISVGAAWVGFLFLRALGRRHLVFPQLGDEIRRMHEEGRGDPDYYI
jgi:uncharacterized membrane protein YfcA